MQDLDLFLHLSCLLGAGLDEVHTLVSLILDDVIQLGKLLQSEKTFQHLRTDHYHCCLKIALSEIQTNNQQILAVLRDTTHVRLLEIHSLLLHLLMLLLVVLYLQLLRFEVLHSPVEAHLRPHEVSRLLLSLISLVNKHIVCKTI